jgi:hypothetical protein
MKKIASPKKITAQNYTENAIAYSDLNETSFVIALEDGSKLGVEWGGNKKAWGAWRAYWKRIGHKGMVGFMDKNVGTSNFCLTVPTLWPFEFDPEGSTFEKDQQAGNAFLQGYRPPSPKMADAARRAMTVIGYKAGKVVKADWSKAPPDYRVRPDYRPFPKLWEAFQDQPELLEGRSFDALMAASGLLAKYGRNAALEHLKAS